MRACPPPWSPAPVCYQDNKRELGLRHTQTTPDPNSDMLRSGPDLIIFPEIIPGRTNYDLLGKGELRDKLAVHTKLNHSHWWLSSSSFEILPKKLKNKNKQEKTLIDIEEKELPCISTGYGLGWPL